MISRILISILILSSTAGAATKSTAKSSAKVGHSKGSPFHFSIGIDGASGTIGSVNGTSVRSRSMYFYGVNASAGLKIYGFIAGIGGNYALWRQPQDAAQLGNTNLKGTETSYGPLFGYDFGSIVISATSYVSSVYSVDNPDSLGRAVTYYSPSTAYMVQLIYQNGFWFFGLQYSSMKYLKTSVAGVESPLAAGAVIDSTCSGAIIGFML